MLGYTQGGDGKWYDNGNYVGEINNALASLKFSDAITSGINIDEVLKAVKLGEIMGKRYENGKWYDGATEIVADNVANEIMLKLYSKTYSEITTTGIDFATLTDGIYFGKVLGYTQQADGKWYKNGKFVGEMDNAIASLKLSDAMTTGVNIDDAIKNVKLGEIMGKRYENGKWYDGDTEIIANSIANDIMIKLYSKTYSEITTTGIDFAMLTEGVYFGKALGYEIGSTTDTAYCENNCLANHTHKYYWVKNGKFVGDMNNAMSNISLQQAMQGKVTIDGLFDDVKLGYIMGHSYDNGKWYDADGNLINYDELDDGGQKILYKMYNQTVGVLTHNGFALDVVLKGMKVGEIMGYKYESNKWQKPSTTGYIDATAIESLMADINMEDMLNGNVDYKSKINNLSLGDVIDVSSSKVLSSLANTNIGGLSTAIESLSIGKLMGYVKNGDKWYDNGKEVTGLYGALSEYTIGQLSAGNVSIDNLKIGDLITVADSPILALLKDKTLSDAPHAANKLYLGEVMGYTKQADGKWYKNGVEATKITAKMADYTIEQVADGELDKIMASLTIGDVLSADKGVFAVMEIGSFTDGDTTYSAYDSAAQVPVSEISIRLTRGVKNASYTALKSAGIDLFDAETEASIDSFYSSIYPMLNPTKPVSNWKDQQLTKIVKDIVDTMNLLANRG